MAGVFEHHDKSRFEIALIPFGRGHGSEMRSRIESACEHSIDIHGMSDGEAARRLRSMEIDILVDFAGLSGSNRTGVLALRPAPVQVNFLFPGTTGAPFIDYFIADRVVIPASHRPHYSENVVYLPDTFMPNDATRPISARKPTRSELGLPADGFVFCCFNNSFKYTPAVFDVWMRLLRSVEKSVLWLPRFNEAVVENLRRRPRRGESAASGLYSLALSARLRTIWRGCRWRISFSIRCPTTRMPRLAMRYGSGFPF
jgi:predicted O-linked N-acetylglucosamine transferase (SPINDLY family)